MRRLAADAGWVIGFITLALGSMLRAWRAPRPVTTIEGHVNPDGSGRGNWSATTPPVAIVTAPNIAAHEEAMEQLRGGLHKAAATVDRPELEPLWDERRGEYTESVGSWDRLVDEAAYEIAPSVAQMLEDAIAKRLPSVSDR